MSCVLGGVTLDNTPRWTDRNKYEDLSSEVSTAIDGNEIVVNAARGDNYPITLEMGGNDGWIKGSTVTSLRALSAVANAYYTLTLNGSSYKVRFRNEQGGGAIQVDTVLNISAPGVDDYYNGTIYLMAVA